MTMKIETGPYSDLHNKVTPQEEAVLLDYVRELLNYLTDPEKFPPLTSPTREVLIRSAIRQLKTGELP